MNKPQYIIVHHTGGSDSNPLADTSHHTIDHIRGWHKAKGWRDVGYHYVIHKDGSVHKGREENDTGAHTRGYNAKSIGICLTGNFDATLPTQEQKESLKKLLKDVSSRYNIGLENIVPHRTFAKKTCYGNNLTDDWARSLLIEEPMEKKSFTDGKKTYGFIIVAAVLIFRTLDIDISEAEITELVEAGAVFIALLGAAWGRYVAKTK